MGRNDLRRADVLVAAACGLVALATLFLAWVREAPSIDADDARTVARSALAAAGIEDADLVAGPVADVYEPAEGPRLEVWTMTAAVQGGEVTLRFGRDDAELVFVRDVTDDGTRQLLDDEQFDALSNHYENPAYDRQLRRNLLGSVAAAGVVVMAVLVPTVGRRAVGRGAPEA